jgi:chromosome segregation ATPase
MPKSIATYESVAQAADTLLTSGQEPSLIAIHGKIGGSFSTIKRHLDSWLTQRTAAQVIQVPESVTEQGTAFIRDIWRIAEAQAAQQVTAIQKDAEKQIAGANQHTAEALAIIERVEQENEQHTTQIAQQSTELDQLRTAISNTQATLAAANAQVLAAEQRVSQLVQENAQLRTELTAQAMIAGEAEALRRQVAELQGMIERMGKRGK